jgi:hypothetical protein
VVAPGSTLADGFTEGGVDGTVVVEGGVDGTVVEGDAVGATEGAEEAVEFVGKVDGSALTLETSGVFEAETFTEADALGFAVTFLSVVAVDVGGLLGQAVMVASRSDEAPKSRQKVPTRIAVPSHA